MKSQDGEKVLQAVRELVPTLSARSTEIEQSRRLPADLLQQLKDAGVFRMFVPRSHGGYEVDLRTGNDVLELLARADGATGWTVMIGCESPHLFSLLPKESFDRIYSSSPDVIMGGGFNAQGRADIVEGGYQVTGRWAFASGCEHVDWMLANCVLMRDGQPLPGPMEGIPATRGVLVPASQGRVIDTWKVLGLRGTGSHDIALEGVFCPEAYSLDIFTGMANISGPNFVAPLLHFLLHMSAVAIGIAQGALDDTVELATSGKQRLYARAPLSQSSVFQLHLGRAETQVRAARALLRDISNELWSACIDDPPAAAALAPKISATLAWVTETTVTAVDSLYRAGGGGAARDVSPLQRRFRDIHTFSQHAAAAEGWFGQAGALLLGQPTGFWT